MSQIESGRSDPVALEFGESGGGVTVVAVFFFVAGVVVTCNVLVDDVVIFFCYSLRRLLTLEWPSLPLLWSQERPRYGQH